jgi:hypothetical protein
MKTLMREIRLRYVPIEVVAVIKSNAILQGTTMELYLIELITKAVKAGKKRR